MAAGDPAAFDAIDDEYRARLDSFLVRLFRRRELAEDLLEETWLRLVQHARGIKSGTPLGPWLYTLPRNLYISHCRSRVVEDGRAAGLMGLWPGAARALAVRAGLGRGAGSRDRKRAGRAVPALSRAAPVVARR
jgi:DNA-directed RNA polymerase specialized sigma24 family protein